jgi:murein DD-endopeptidase MepM/ murein hydrolase activator NlpD
MAVKNVLRLRFRWFCGVLVVLGLSALAWSFSHRFSLENQLADEAELAREQAERFRTQVVVYTREVIPEGVGLSTFLQELGFAPASVFQALGAAQQVFDLRRVRAGNLLAVGRAVDGGLRALYYRIDAGRELAVSWRASEFTAQVNEIPFRMDVVGVRGEVRDCLFNAVTDAGEGAELAIALADVFAWDLDFYTDPQPGDTFRLVVEKKTYGHREPVLQYGRILAAEYRNQGRVFQAVLFREPSGQPAYYAPDGKSMKKAFLRSPLKFRAPITSHFSNRRFHPILKIYRPHLGVDYGAPAGTPVQAIGGGTVVFVGWKGDAGKMVRLRHTGGYETLYCHLSRILVRVGQRVQQGDLVGLVGATGLATGPHLDFRFLQHGKYRNFEKLRLPPAQPVAKSDWQEFVAMRDRSLALLPLSPVTLARAGGR